MISSEKQRVMVGTALVTLFLSMTASYANPVITPVINFLLNDNDAPSSETVTVYLQDNDTSAIGGTGLFLVPTIGGEPPVLLSTNVRRMADVFSFQISPDRQYAVYTANSTSSLSTTEIWSVRLNGSRPIKLSTTPQHAMTANQFLISSDSKTVVYRADQSTDNQFELYSAPINGTNSSVRISGDLANQFGDVAPGRFRISPDSTRVVFAADADTDTVDEMFSVPIVGGARVKLHAALSIGDDVFDPVISPDNNRVVYAARKGGSFGQYSAVINATGDVQISNSTGTPIISGNSTRVIYVDDQLTNDVFEVFSARITDGASIRLSGAPVSGKSTFPVVNIAPDGETVVYINDEDTPGQNQLYMANVSTGNSPLTLSGQIGPNSDVSSFRFSQDGNTVLFDGDLDTNTVTELYQVPLSGGNRIKVNDDLPLNGDVTLSLTSPALSADGSATIYAADQITSNLLELFSFLGDRRTRLSGQLTAGDTISLAGITPDGLAVIFEKFDSVDNTVALHYSNVRGGGDRPISNVLTGSGDIISYQFFLPASN